HGGDESKGRRKVFRPLATKRPLHITFKSSRAIGGWSLLRKPNAASTASIISKASRQFHVQIRRSANVGNHLHLVIQAKTRRGIQDFLRTVGAQIAASVTGERKGRTDGKFWDSRVF
ncbi:MAG: transposase, partial [Bdellovibrionota bacterium]